MSVSFAVCSAVALISTPKCLTIFSMRSSLIGPRPPMKPPRCHPPCPAGAAHVAVAPMPATTLEISAATAALRKNRRLLFISSMTPILFKSGDVAILSVSCKPHFSAA
jgi:hypothetical protein